MVTPSSTPPADSDSRPALHILVTALLVIVAGFLAFTVYRGLTASDDPDGTVARSEEIGGPDTHGPLKETAAPAFHDGTPRVISDSTFSGEVLNGLSEPVPGASVTFFPNRGPMPNVQAATNDDGQFDVAGLGGTEPYHVRVTHPDYAPAVVKNVWPEDLPITIVLYGKVLVEGQVVEAGAGRPIPEFYITLETGHNMPVPTLAGGAYDHIVDPEGRFKFEEIDTGDVTILVRAEGYAPNRLDIFQLQPGEYRQDVVIALDASPVIQGIVLNHRGAPVEDALIFRDIAKGIEDSGTAAKVAAHALARSAEDGTFQLDMLESWPVGVGASHPDYLPTVQHLDPPLRSPYQIRITMGPGGAVEGTVTVRGVPAANTSMRINYSNGVAGLRAYGNTSTNEEGFYRFERAHPGSAMLHFNLAREKDGPSIRGAPSSSTIPRERMFLWSLPITVIDGQTTTANIDLPAEAFSAGVQGRVISHGQPLTDCDISLEIESAYGMVRRYMKTGKEGVFVIENLPPGDAELSITARFGWSPTVFDRQGQTITLSPGQTVQHDFVVGGYGEVHVQLAGGGEYQMVNLLHGSEWPPTSAMDYVRRQAGHRQMGRDQVVTISGLPPGPYVAYVEAPRRNPPSQEEQRVQSTIPTAAGFGAYTVIPYTESPGYEPPDAVDVIPFHVTESEPAYIELRMPR